MTDTALAPLKIDRRTDDGALVWLDAGDRPVVVMNTILLAQLDGAIDLLEADTPSWVVMASTTDRSFVAGADLAEINSMSDNALTSYMEEGQRVFGRLSSLACPVVAAVGGAALGGGLELALHCHAIVAAQHGRTGKVYPIGLPEAGLGLCPAWGGTQLLAGRIDPTTAVLATAQGKPFKSDDLPSGLADCMVKDGTDVIDQACTLAAGMTSRRPVDITQVDAATLRKACMKARGLCTPAADAVTACIEASLDRNLAAGLAAERANLVALRNTQDTKARIEAFLNRG